MSQKYFFYIHALIVSSAQCYLTVQYSKRKLFGKAASGLLTWLLVTSFLFYDYYAGVNVPVFIVTGSIISVIGHTLLGNYLDYYHKSRIYDRGLHLFGAFSFSLLAFSILNNAVAPFDGSEFYASLTVITLGISIGTFFEIIEFIHDSVSKKTKCQHGLVDTDFDMIFNVLGSLAAGSIAPLVF